MDDTGRPSLSRYWTPRYWLLWPGIGLLRLSCFLPYRWQIALGKWLGRVAFRLAGKRRAITRRNIEICFPELSSSQHGATALAHFESLGASIMEMALGRWAKEEKLLAMCHVEGAEHVWKFADQGIGVILLSAHFTTLEICGPALRNCLPPFDAVYRRNKNELITELLRSCWERSARRTIEKNDIKSMIRSLRDGVPVWYAPDQAYNRKQSALLPFFNIESMTNTATSTLARLGNAVAVPFFPRRLPEGGYALTILPALQGFPSEDPVKDTAQYNAVLEQYVRACPEQYYWVHRKFKFRPEPLPDVYADLDASK
ncbi:MAG: lipid A biosynthesis lauroyl acyltransferase [Gammaproteobacteria bacterium]|nr:lipid A biosynthesis lauroyl acyltransferase [Gammaproteobacteria bacterium]